jgi:uncharacterized membrane protein
MMLAASAFTNFGGGCFAMYRNYFRPLGLLALTVVIWVLLTIEGLFFPVRLIGSLLLIAFLPGYALFSILFRRDALDLTDLAAFVVSFSLGIAILGGILLNLSPFGLSAEGWRLWLAGFTIVALLVSLFRVEAKSDDFAGAHRRPHNLSTSQMMIFAAAIVLFGMSIAIAYEGDRNRPKEEFSQAWLFFQNEAQGLVVMGLNNLESETNSYRIVLLATGTSVHEWEVTLETQESWQVNYLVPRHFLDASELSLVVYRAGETEIYRTATLRLWD